MAQLIGVEVGLASRLPIELGLGLDPDQVVDAEPSVEVVGDVLALGGLDRFERGCHPLEALCDHKAACLRPSSSRSAMTTTWALASVVVCSGRHLPAPIGLQVPLRPMRSSE